MNVNRLLRYILAHDIQLSINKKNAQTKLKLNKILKLTVLSLIHYVSYYV